MRKHPFWIILLITTILWLCYSMSEEGDYKTQIPIQWTGIDTARYAVTYADTVLPVTIKSNCFQAIKRYFVLRQSYYSISVQGDTIINVAHPLFEDLTKQLNFVGISSMYSSKEVLRVEVDERIAKPFVPQLRGVEFNFDGQVGLSGEPRIEPDTVWLYGTASSLNKISQLSTAPTVLEHLSDSGYYTLTLDPVWKDYPDLRSSHDVIRIYLPVDQFTEIKLKVPVTLRSSSQLGRVRLYPDQVDVSLWVPRSDYNNISASQIEVVADYDAITNSQQIPVLVTRFPSNTRIKQVSPASIQYVIIK